MRSAGCLPNASSNRVTPPVGDSLVPDSCSGLDKLSVRDLLEEASDVPALVEFEHDFELRLQESYCCFSSIWPRCVWSQQDRVDFEGLIEVLPCLRPVRFDLRQLMWAGSGTSQSSS